MLISEFRLSRRQKAIVAVLAGAALAGLVVGLFIVECAFYYGGGK